MASSTNATRHGILSSRFVAPHEDRPLFEELLAQLIAEFQPHTALESMLVDRLAILLWRERRLATAEAELVSRRFDNATDPFSGVSLRSLPLTEQYLVGRYQGMLGRQIKDTVRGLREERDRHLQMIEALEDQNQSPERTEG